MRRIGLISIPKTSLWKSLPKPYKGTTSHYSRRQRRVRSSYCRRSCKYRTQYKHRKHKGQGRAADNKRSHPDSEQ